LGLSLQNENKGKFMRPPEFVKSLYSVIDRARNFFIIGIFSFIVFSGALEIFLRYTPGMRGLSWSDEIMRYLDIWLVFLGAGLTAKANGHMAMDFFVRKLFSASAQPVVRRLTLGIICIALLSLMWVSLLKTLSTRDVMIQAFDISIAYFYAAIPVGCLLMFIEYALQLVFGEHPFAAVKETSK
jgi:TRAP-type C4-dicarboxylate transport system permease small subunit